MKYDYGIIGGGPAGYTAALHAAKEGKTVVLFEKNFMGGVCLNRGCIPTKAILHSAEMYQKIKKSAEIGVNVENVQIDYAKVIERKDKVVEKLRKSLDLSIKNAKINVVNAEARVLSGNIIEAAGQNFECEKILVATGAKPRAMSGFDFDHEFILSSDDVLNLTTLPEKVLIVGSGAIGIEWARIYSAFDVHVTLVELAERLLPPADIEVSKRIERIFKSKKVKMHLSTSVKSIEDKKVTLSSGEVLEPDFILVAIGRECVKPEINSAVTLLGDVSGKMQLAHCAIHEACECVTDIPFNQKLVPSVVYGEPEIAWVGLREQDLKPDTYKKVTMLVSALGKAHCDNETEGFIKILASDNQIIGAHIVSKEASSLIQQIIIAMQNNVSVDKLKEVCFAHPTYSEGIYESIFRL